MHALCQRVVGSGLFLGAVESVVSMQAVAAQGLNEIKPCWKALRKILVKEPDPKRMNQSRAHFQPSQLESVIKFLWDSRGQGADGPGMQCMLWAPRGHRLPMLLHLIVSM